MSQSSGDIVTPEAVVLEFSMAGLATRAIAKIIDLFAMAAVFVLLMFVTTLLITPRGTGAVILVTVGLFLDLLALPAAVETLWNGRSPGKALMGLRVVTVDGGPIAFRHALVRNLIQIVELPSGIAMITALVNRRSQRVGDLLAGTFVIRVRRSGDTAGAVAFYPPPGCEGYIDVLDVTRVTSQQFLLIRKFLLRVSQLDLRARYDLAVRMATPVRGRVTPQPPQQMGPELYLVCVASAYQIRNGGLPSRPFVAPPAFVPSGTPGYYSTGQMPPPLPPQPLPPYAPPSQAQPPHR